DRHLDEPHQVAVVVLAHLAVQQPDDDHDHEELRQRVEEAAEISQQEVAEGVLLAVGRDAEPRGSLRATHVETPSIMCAKTSDALRPVAKPSSARGRFPTSRPTCSAAKTTRRAAPARAKRGMSTSWRGTPSKKGATLGRMPAMSAASATSTAPAQPRRASQAAGTRVAKPAQRASAPVPERNRARAMTASAVTPAARSTKTAARR